MSLPIEDQRSLCHRLLRLPGGHHDVFVMLIRIGDESSVPYLIRSLRWAPEVKDGEGVACTWAHCNAFSRQAFLDRPGLL